MATNILKHLASLFTVINLTSYVWADATLDIERNFSNATNILPSRIYIDYELNGSAAPFYGSIVGFQFGYPRGYSKTTLPDYSITFRMKDFIPSIIDGFGKLDLFLADDYNYNAQYTDIYLKKYAFDGTGLNAVARDQWYYNALNKSKTYLPVMLTYDTDYIKSGSPLRINDEYSFPVLKMTLAVSQGKTDPQVAGCIVGYPRRIGGADGGLFITRNDSHDVDNYIHKRTLLQSSFYHNGLWSTLTTKFALAFLGMLHNSGGAARLNSNNARYLVGTVSKVGEIRLINLIGRYAAVERVTNAINSNDIRGLAYSNSDNLSLDYDDDREVDRLDLYYISPSEVLSERSKRSGKSVCDW